MSPLAPHRLSVLLVRVRGIVVGRPKWEGWVGQKVDSAGSLVLIIALASRSACSDQQLGMKEHILPMTLHPRS